MALPLLEAAAHVLGHPLTAEQVQRFERFRILLTDWNSKINVTAIRDDIGVETLHFVDALSGLAALPQRAGVHVVDVGSGGGLPGLALRVARPDLHLTLVDSIAKKVRVITEIATGIGLTGTPADGGPPVRLITGRAEELGQDSRFRESFDVATARAVGATVLVAELTLPLVKQGGRLVLWKKREIDDELAEAAGAFEKLGGRLGQKLPVNLPGLPSDRQVITVEKVGRTPAKYPRAAALLKKEPLR